MLTNFEKVCEFNNAMGGAKDINTQLRLITEEFAELFVEVPTAVYAMREEHRLPKDEVAECVGALAKEAVDLLYVTYGLLQLLDINADCAFSEVHESNMSKLGEDGKPIKREDGKILKGPNYSPVDPVELYETSKFWPGKDDADV